MNASTLALNSATEVKEPRRSSLRARMLSQSSIWFSHEACLGVYV